MNMLSEYVGKSFAATVTCSDGREVRLNGLTLIEANWGYYGDGLMYPKIRLRNAEATLIFDSGDP